MLCMLCACALVHACIHVRWSRAAGALALSRMCISQGFARLNPPDVALARSASQGDRAAFWYRFESISKMGELPKGSHFAAAKRMHGGVVETTYIHNPNGYGLSNVLLRQAERAGQPWPPNWSESHFGTLMCRLVRCASMDTHAFTDAPIPHKDRAHACTPSNWSLSMRVQTRTCMCLRVSRQALMHSYACAHVYIHMLIRAHAHPCT